MNLKLLIGSLMILLFYSCKQETSWLITQVYPDGSTKVQVEYYLDGSDSVFIFQKVFSIEGLIQVEGALKEGKRDGTWKSFYSDGVNWSQTNFKNGVFHGETETWYQNGKLRYSGNYYNGEKSGNWIWFDSTGTLIKDVNFEIEEK